MGFFGVVTTRWVQQYNARQGTLCYGTQMCCDACLFKPSAGTHSEGYGSWFVILINDRDHNRPSGPSNLSVP